jgi:multiple sugar transport system substrate-binding protein
MTPRCSNGSALLIGIAFLISACSIGPSASPTPSVTASVASGSSAPSGSAAASPAMIQASGRIFAFAVSDGSSDVMDQGRIDLFRQKYPNVELTFSDGDFDPQKFLMALQSSDKPDVVRIPRDRIGSYVARGVLEPLDDCVSRVGIDIDNYYDAAVKQVTVDGNLYGMPEYFWTSNWLIDDDLFKQAGLDPSTWDVSNWDQIKAANNALIRSTKTKVAIDPKIWDNGDRFPEWVAAAGGQMLSDDGKESELDTPEVADALIFTKSLIDAQGGLVRFKDAIGQTGNFVAGDGFKKNLEAAFPMQQWYLNDLAVATPTTRFTALPFLDKTGQPKSFEEGDSLSIVASSDNKDAACAFVTTMVSTDAWIAAATTLQQQAEADKKLETGSVTGNREADQQIFSSLVDLSGNPTFKKAVEAYNSTFDSALALPPTPAAEEFRQAWVDAVNSVLVGDKDAQTALQEADQTAQDAIAAAGP